jgi:molybdopterin converting factor small subunit
VTVTIELIGSFCSISKKSRLVIDLENPLMLKKLMKKVVEMLPNLKGTLVNPDHGGVKAGVLVLINGSEIGVLEGPETIIEDGDELVLIPVAHGG